MNIKKLSTTTDSRAILKKIGVSKEGVEIISKKMQINLFYIKDLKTPAANILKQDALSIGAELAVEKDTIICKNERVDALLIATNKQLKQLSQKERAQPFGLKELAKKLSEYLNEKSFDRKIMGILNANDDSFFSKSRFDVSSATQKIERMIEDGADIIDIGGVSSRPGSKPVTQEEELERIRDIVSLIDKKEYHKFVKFSLDSYALLPIKYALDHGFSIINDITGLKYDDVCKVAGEYKATVVIMHMKGEPSTMQNDPKYDDLFDEVGEFFSTQIKKAESFGIEDIILDVGIGFGKRLEDNLLLIKHLSTFKRFNKELLVGASRKSMIDMIKPTPVEKRLPATLALHIEAMREGANILRVHDVKEHREALSVLEAIDGVLI